VLAPTRRLYRAPAALLPLSLPLPLPLPLPLSLPLPLLLPLQSAKLYG
jgi:hypothetical protein